jgi:hypothetical protein
MSEPLKLVTHGGEEMTVGSKSWATRLRNNAKDLSGRLESGYMQMAEILYYVYDTPSSEPPHQPLFLEWGYKTFAEYAESELGLHRRKAEFLRRIWYRLEVELSGLDLKIKDRIIALGWTKVRELIRVLTLLNAEKWVERAENESYTTLCVSTKAYLESVAEAQEHAKTIGEDPEKVEPGLPKIEKFKPKHFQLYEEQAEVVEEALHKAAVLTGSSDPKPGHLLTMMATDFLATNSVSSSGHDAQLKYLAKLEQQMGLKLIAVDPDSNEVLYGITTLEKLAQSEE